MNITRWMLKEKNLPQSFWGEAVKTACYVVNRNSTNKLTNVLELVYKKRLIMSNILEYFVHRVSNTFHIKRGIRPSL